ncbi:MAG: NarK/NasA family nitrate transporter [Acidobacteriaceae bacterium]|nr:NarK/NasA family nitrate transporter [Acidobacteriaceae bacterium]
MSLRSFRNAGHVPTLVSAFLYFDVSFMVWVIFGPLGPFIGEAFHLSATQKGFLTALPLLGGSFFRPILGWSTERFGGRRTGLAGMALTLIPLILAWKFAASFGGFLALGLLLGIAGASFAAALPLASAWYPPEHQGLAMGIAGAGNSGTLLATLFAPRLAQALGWRNVFAIAAIPIIIVWLIFFFLAKDAPGERRVKKWSDYASVLKIGDTAWFCFLYSLTFGGFSGFASYLSIFFHDQYHLTKIQSGDFTTCVVLFGSFLRPVGGMLADRIGGYRMLLLLFAIAIVSVGMVATLPPATVALGFLAICMAMLGMGNGSIFQLVPQRFPDRVGIMTGLVGAAGGFGGFLLPSLMGTLKDRTGTFSTGFLVIAGLFLCGLTALILLREVWRKTWPADAAERAGLSLGASLTEPAYVAE